MVVFILFLNHHLPNNLPKAGDDVGGGKSVGGDLCKLIINGCVYILFKPSFTE